MGQAKENIHNPGDDGIDPSPEGTRCQAQAGADQGADGRRQQAHPQAQRHAVKRTAEHISP